MPPTLRPFQALTAHSAAPERMLLQADRGPIEIVPVAPGIARVRVGRRRRLPAYRSLAVGALPPAPAGETQSQGGQHSLALPGLSVLVEAEPVRLSFARPGGTPIAAGLSLAVRGEEVVARLPLSPEQHVYGLGEKTGWLDKRHRRYRMRNTDVLLERQEGIGIATDPLYAAFPVFIVHGPGGSYGIFVDNPEFTTFDLSGEACEFAAPAAALNFYVLAGSTLPAVVEQYTALTGRLALPPLWALGYHQCRWGYRTEAEMRAVAAELRERGLPADALWFDIDYMDGYRVFTWDRRRFPRPAHLLADLKQMGLRGVTIVDPGVKVDPDYDVYQEGQAGGHFVQHADGREYHASVWPGRSALPDFHEPATRAWWAGRVRRWMAENGLAGIWNDMNEPAGSDLSGPVAEARHAEGRLPHAEARNTYGLEMARATHAGLLAHAPDTRPFILTRAAYSGAQTVTALWGGDNSPLWEHLAGSLPMLMNLGLSGMPFVGVDIGGFAGDTHGELLARWFQAGAFYPFCRNHAMAGTNAHEPWAFGPKVEAIARRALELRYQLLPYLYNLFYEAARTGAPIMRPLVWHYPDDPATYNLNDQFLFGRDVLVAPVVQPGQSARLVYLPEGVWYRWGSDARVEGPAHLAVPAPLEETPLYARAGAIIPMWPAAPHTGAVQRGALRLHLWPGRGTYDYYEDDGASLAYTRGDYRLTNFDWRAGGVGATLKWAASLGAYRDDRTEWTFVFHALPEMKAEVDGKGVRGRREGDTFVVAVPDNGQGHTLRLTRRA
jgi:alpha-glucosidase